MKYGVAVVSPRVAIRSVCVYHPPGQMGVVWLALYHFVLMGRAGAPPRSDRSGVPQVEKVLWKNSLLEPHTHTCSSGIEEGY